MEFEEEQRNYSLNNFNEIPPNFTNYKNIIKRSNYNPNISVKVHYCMT